MAREPINRKWNEQPDAPQQYEQPDNATWEDGWRGGAIEQPPKARYQNWWQRRVDDALQDIERRGAPSWVPGAIYETGAYARGSNGTIYRSAINGNQGVDPVLNVSGNWQTFADYIASILPVQQLRIQIGVPAGTVIYHAASVTPSGYLKANGQSVSRLEYAALFAAIGTTYGSGNGSTTFNVPDLRGEFVRGWHDGRSVDAGRAFGSSQSDAFQNHAHTARLRGGYQNPGGNTNAADIDGGSSTYTTLIGSPIAIGGNGNPRTANETRPRNIAMLACIKF